MSAPALAAGAEGNWPQLVLIDQNPAPVITINSLGAEGNKYGFEAGQVVKIGKTYHMVISETMGDPFWVKMKLAHWSSVDRLHWERVSTLYTSSGEFEGKDPRASLWCPSVAFDEKEDRWNLFYIAYRCLPNTLTQWRLLYEARVWRAVSQTKGIYGIDGPYDDVGVVLEPGPDSKKWEGLQGDDSFFPYKVGETWYAFYGTANTEHVPVQHWRVGLATAPTLAGPWKRVDDPDPVPIQDPFIEVPVVTHLDDGTYVAVFDSEVKHSVGYTFSPDGIHWSRGQRLIVQPEGSKGLWGLGIRTPMGLIPEGNGTFTLLYTGFQRITRFADRPEPPQGAVGLVTVKLQKHPASPKP
jgi:hypothetical protein